MADYKESNVAGSEWHRFSRVFIDNPLGGPPLISCLEQRVISLASGDMVTDLGLMTFPFDPLAEVPVLDPATGEPTGHIALGLDVHALIYSFVMAQAHKRDAFLQAAAAAEIAAAQEAAAAEIAAAQEAAAAEIAAAQAAAAAAQGDVGEQSA